MALYKSLPAVNSSLNDIHNLLTEYSQIAGLDNSKSYKLVLAVDEVATNIINHGYKENGLTGNIDIKITIENGEIKVELEDTAVRFDPRKYIIPGDKELKATVEERPIGGLGVFLALRSVDKFEYEYIKGKNKNIFIVKTN